MIAATGVGRAGALLLALATVTTNFVNIYLSSLAWKSLWPRSADQAAVWSIGIIGTALGLISGAWLTHFAELMLVLGSVLVPVGALLITHFFLLRRPVRIADLYDPDGPHGRGAGVHWPAAVAWVAGVVAYHSGTGLGSTLPALLVTAVVYAAATRTARGAGPAQVVP
jgi:NCS1 family nucleobase:cation symporter-1